MDSPYKPIPFDSFGCVRRTRGDVSTFRWKIRRNYRLVEADDPDGAPFHTYLVLSRPFGSIAPLVANRLSSSSLRTENFEVAVTGRAVMTISHPGFNDTSRKISRKRRLTWFRTVAFPTRLLTDKPNRACSPFRSRVRSSRRLDRQIRPCLAIAIKSFFSVTCLFIGVMRQCYRVGYSFTAI